MTAKPSVEGEPTECDGSAWDRLPPLIIAAHRGMFPVTAVEAVVGRAFAVRADAEQTVQEAAENEVLI